MEQALRRHDASGNGLLELGEFSDVVATLRLKKLQELTVTHKELRKAKAAQDGELKKTKSKLDAATALMASVPPVSGFIPADVREAFEQFQQKEKGAVPSGGKTDWLKGGKVEEGGAGTLARGTLGYTEVRSALKEAGVELEETKEVKEAALAKYDADRAGKLELGEFWTLVHVLRRAQYQGVAAELKKLRASAKKAEEELAELRDELGESKGSRNARRGGPSVPAEIQAAFDRYDANKSGKLDYSELQKALQAAGLEISEHQAAAMLQRYGRGRAGLMDVEEFAELVLSLRRQLLDSYAAEAMALREQLRLALGGKHPESSKAVGVPPDVRAAFERFDANASGKLDYTELQEALRAMGLDPSVSHAEEQLRKYDRDGNGLLELDEFAALCRELPRHMLDGYGRDFAALNGQMGGKDDEIGRLRGELNELRSRLDAKSLDGGPPPRGAVPARYGDGHDDRGVRDGASAVYGDDVYGHDGGAEHVRVSLSARDLRLGEEAKQRGGGPAARGKPSSKVAGKPARPSDKNSKATRKEQALQQVLGGDGYDGFGDGDDGDGDGIGGGSSSRGERRRAGEREAYYYVLHGLDAGGFIGWARLGASRNSDGRSPRWDAVDVAAHKFDGARKLRIDVYSGHGDGGGGGGGGGGGSGGVMDLAEFASLVRKLRRSGAGGGSKAGPLSASGGGRKWSDAEIQGAFQSFDANKSGKLDHKELRPALKKMGVPSDTSEAVRLLQEYDKNNDGLLSLAEFGKLVRALAGAGSGAGSGSGGYGGDRGGDRGGDWSDAEVRTAFQRAAVTSRSGAGAGAVQLLGYRELRGVLRQLGADVEEREAADVLRHYDGGVVGGDSGRSGVGGGLSGGGFGGGGGIGGGGSSGGGTILEQFLAGQQGGGSGSVGFGGGSFGSGGKEQVIGGGIGSGGISGISGIGSGSGIGGVGTGGGEEGEHLGTVEIELPSSVAELLSRGKEHILKSVSLGPPPASAASAARPGASRASVAAALGTVEGSIVRVGGGSGRAGDDYDGGRRGSGSAHAAVPPRVREAFERSDRNRTGKLDSGELRDALRASGLDASTHDAEAVLRRFDAGHSTKMELEEFAELVDEIHRESLKGAVREVANLRGEIDRLRGGGGGGGHGGGHGDGQGDGQSGRNVAADIRAAFERFDTNKSGKLDFKELRGALTAMGLEVGQERAAAILQEYDADGSGLMELNEFEQLVASQRGLSLKALQMRHATDRETSAAALQYERAIGEALGAADVRAAFERFDTNKSGTLDPKELRGALKTVGLDPTEQQAAALLKKYDQRGNGTLTPPEFAALVAAYRRVRLDGLGVENAKLRAQLARGTSSVPMDVQASFERYDAARSGTLDAKELRAALKALGLDLSSKATATQLQKHDANGNGLTEPAEFGALVGALRATPLELLTTELAAARAQLGAARGKVPADVRAAFERFDTDKNGKLEYKELRGALQAAGLHADAKAAASLLAEFDRDRSGTMELGEFHDLIRTLRSSMHADEATQEATALRAALAARDAELANLRTELARHGGSSGRGVPADIRAAFERFDVNQSGMLDSKELRGALQAAGLQPSAQEVERLLQRHDADRNGLLDLAEFSQLVSEMRGTRIQGASGELDSLRAGLGTKDEELARLANLLSQKEGELVLLRRELSAAKQVPDAIRAAFERYDRNRRGQLDPRDLRSALHAAHVDTQAAEAAAIIGQAEAAISQASSSAGAPRLLELGEFGALVARLKQGAAAAAVDELKALKIELTRMRREQVSGAEGDVRAAFARFDPNRSGSLDPRSLRAALASLQLDASTTEAAALLSRHADRGDRDPNRVVDLAEFAQLVGELRRAGAAAAGTGGAVALTAALAARDLEIVQLKRTLQSRGLLANTSSVSDEVQLIAFGRHTFLLLLYLLTTASLYLLWHRCIYQVQLAFGRFDTRRSGRLDVRELHAALQAVGLDASTGGAAALVARHERGPGAAAAAVDLGAFSALVEQLRAMQLSTSTAELAALRGELGAKDRELEALRRELEAARAALGQSRRVPDDVRAALALDLLTSTIASVLPP